MPSEQLWLGRCFAALDTNPLTGHESVARATARAVASRVLRSEGTRFPIFVVGRVVG